MLPNLRTQLPWRNIQPLYINPGPYIRFPSGKCNKIHILGKKEEIQVKNRNYITENIICKDENCQTNKKIKVIKKNGAQIIPNSNKKSQLTIFFQEFVIKLAEYAENYQKKLDKIKKIPEKYLQPTYINKKACDFFNVKKIWGYNPKNMYVHSLLLSNDPLDIKLIIHYHKLKKPGFIINEYFSEMGTQCYGHYQNHLFIKLFNMYVYVNLMIINDCFNQNNKNYQLSNYRFWSSFLCDGDFVDFIPALRVKYFDLKYINQFGYHNRKNNHVFRDTKVFKNNADIPEFLRELFRYMFKVKLLLNYCDHNYELISYDPPYYNDLYINPVFVQV